MADCKTEIILIAALCKVNRVIGRNGTLPWHLPDDLNRFRALTTGHAILMGRKTWEYGLNRRSLPNRHSIIVSRTLRPCDPQLEPDTRTSRCIVSSLYDAFHPRTHHSKIFVIGGASLYSQTLPLANRLELTLVDGRYEGDAFFPNYQSVVHETFSLIHEGRYPGFQTQTYIRQTP